MKRTNLVEIYSFIASTQEVREALLMTRNQFSRFKTKAELLPYRTFGKCEYFHLSDLQQAFAKETNIYTAMELLKKIKKRDYENEKT